MALSTSDRAILIMTIAKSIYICQKLKINEKTVRSKYSRARAMLISALKKNDEVYQTTNYANKF